MREDNPCTYQDKDEASKDLRPSSKRLTCLVPNHQPDECEDQRSCAHEEGGDEY